MELTNEQIVTGLLTSNEVLTPRKGKFQISNPLFDTLGDFLLDIKEIVQPVEKSAESKYVFIRQ